jgi:hypothetical protein
MARYECEEVFTRDLPIYDLSDFCNAIRLCQSPELDLSNENYFLLRDPVTKGKFITATSSLSSTDDGEVELNSEASQFFSNCFNIRIRINTMPTNGALHKILEKHGQPISSSEQKVLFA